MLLVSIRRRTKNLVPGCVIRGKPECRGRTAVEYCNVCTTKSCITTSPHQSEQQQRRRSTFKKASPKRFNWLRRSAKLSLELHSLVGRHSRDAELPQDYHCRSTSCTKYLQVLVTNPILRRKLRIHTSRCTLYRDTRCGVAQLRIEIGRTRNKAVCSKTMQQFFALRT